MNLEELIRKYLELTRQFGEISISDDTPEPIKSDLTKIYNSLHSQMEAIEDIAFKNGWWGIIANAIIQERNK